jgi:hypothetical protein
VEHWKTARSTSRSYSTLAQRLVGTGIASISFRLNAIGAARQCPLMHMSADA